MAGNETNEWRLVYMNGRGPGGHIWSIESDAGTIGGTSCEKNGRIMKSAPELLKALEEAERVIRWAAQESAGRVKAEIVGGWLHHADIVRDTIAKAKA